MSHILPRYQRNTIAQHDARKLNRILNETTTDTNTDKHHRSTAPGDRRKLRGIPVAGGASGTSPGTDPLQALLDKEHHAVRRTMHNAQREPRPIEP